MPLSEIIQSHGQQRAVDRLRAAIRGPRLHHAFLLSGSPGVGVPELAARFAEALLCPNDPEGDGRCPACERARRGLHPDLRSIGLERDSGAREVKVEAVRALCASLQLRPAEAKRKVALLLNADRLNPAAQNALLKTLEEPPPRTVLILAAEGEDRLLPTVRSRVLRVALQPLSLDHLTRALLARSPPLDAESASLLARLARGSLVRAEHFAGSSGGGFRARRERVLTQLQRLLLARGQPEAVGLALALGAEAAEDRAQAAETLELAAAYLRDALVVRAQPDRPAPLLAPDRRGDLATVAERLSPSALVDGLDGLREAVLALEGNGSPRLQIEAAGLRLAGLAA